MEKHIPTPDGLTLWSQRFGDPRHPAVLLVMGAMNQGIFWPDAFCESLAAAGHCVIRYDHRDTGQSASVTFLHPYNLNTLARDAVAVLDGWGLPRATVVGISMGGFIAQLMALHHPEHVDRIVLLATSADHRPYVAATMMGLPGGLFALPAPEKGFLDYVRDMRQHPPQSPTDMLASMSRGWEVTYAGPRPYPRVAVEAVIQHSLQRAANPMAAINHSLAVAASGHRLQSVQNIQVPTLVIHGRYDPCLPLAHGEYLARHIPDAEFVVLDMGHAFMWSWDDEVLDAVRVFIQKQA